MATLLLSLGGCVAPLQRYEGGDAARVRIRMNSSMHLSSQANQIRAVTPSGLCEAQTRLATLSPAASGSQEEPANPSSAQAATALPREGMVDATPAERSDTAEYRLRPGVHQVMTLWLGGGWQCGLSAQYAFEAGEQYEVRMAVTESPARRCRLDAWRWHEQQRRWVPTPRFPAICLDNKPGTAATAITIPADGLAEAAAMPIYPGSGR